MSKEIATIKGASYVVTPTEDGYVSLANGTVVTSFTAGNQSWFLAPAERVIVSDENALVGICFNSASQSAQGGGGDMAKHLKDLSIHLSPEERLKLEQLLADFTSGALPVPDGAMSHAAIRAHFLLNAQSGVTQTPSAVYVSRVPWARWEGDSETGQWVNNDSTVDETIFGVPRKFMDNSDLRHECSTDKVEGVDDYNGKLWPFYWQHGNYMTDEYGIKHVTTIKGSPGFDAYSKNVCAFGPAFWFFCCLEHYCEPDTGRWYTHDGTQTGTPLFQLWGIATRPWAELDETRRAELMAHGVRESDFHLWPECLQRDVGHDNLVARPYWIHAAYGGGAEKQSDGTFQLVSKRDVPAYNNLSFKTITSMHGGMPGWSGAACVTGFGVLFDIVKNATKNSREIHKGLAASYYSQLASLSTSEPGYVFPVADTRIFEVGCTVLLGQESVVSYQCGYNPTDAQLVRIKAIEYRSFATEDGSTVESPCLVFDSETVQDFVVCSGADAEAAIAAAREQTEAGRVAYCYVTLSVPLTGETEAIIGMHDGARESYTSGLHPYRVMGTEYANGLGQIAEDTIACKGTGAVPVNIDGVDSTPSENQYVILQAPPGVVRKYVSSLQEALTAGYMAVALLPAYSSAAYIVNAQIGKTGVVFPVSCGGTGSGADKGHGNMFENSASPATYIMEGTLINRAGGSAGLSLTRPLYYGWYYYGARA